MINAKDKTLRQSTSLPDVRGSVDLLLQPIKLGVVTKKQVSGLTVETTEWTWTKAVRQAYSAEQLVILPEGQRSWKWYTIHALPDLVLNNDDIIVMHSMRMRVMEKLDYQEYGFVEYHAIEDYTNE
jgi:hypothetical protein